LGEVGPVLKIGCTKGSSKNVGKTCWTELTYYMEEEKEFLEKKNVTLGDM